MRSVFRSQAKFTDSPQASIGPVTDDNLNVAAAFPSDEEEAFLRSVLAQRSLRSRGPYDQVMIVILMSGNGGRCLELEEIRSLTASMRERGYITYQNERWHRTSKGKGLYAEAIDLTPSGVEILQKISNGAGRPVGDNVRVVSQHAPP